MKQINTIKKEFDKKIEKLAKPANIELLKSVQSRLKDNQYICSGMGSTSIYEINENYEDKEEIENSFSQELNSIIWEQGSWFDLPYKFNNKRILTDDIQKAINNYFTEYGCLNSFRLKEFPELINYHVTHIRFIFTGICEPDIIKKETADKYKIKRKDPKQ